MNNYLYNKIFIKLIKEKCQDNNADIDEIIDNLDYFKVNISKFIKNTIEYLINNIND